MPGLENPLITCLFLISQLRNLKHLIPLKVKLPSSSRYSWTWFDLPPKEMFGRERDGMELLSLTRLLHEQHLGEVVFSEQRTVKLNKAELESQLQAPHVPSFPGSYVNQTLPPPTSGYVVTKSTPGLGFHGPRHQKKRLKQLIPPVSCREWENLWNARLSAAQAKGWLMVVKYEKVLCQRQGCWGSHQLIPTAGHRVWGNAGGMADYFKNTWAGVTW